MFLCNKMELFYVNIMRKKFRILPEGEDNQPPKKKFEIKRPKKFEVKSVTPAPEGEKKTFRIKEDTRGRSFLIVRDLSHSQVDHEGREIEWVHQNDADSCGPATIFNSANFLEIPDFEGDVSAIVAKIDQIRESRGDRPRPGARIFNFDIQNYFQEKGFRTEIMTNPHFDQEEAMEKLSRRSFKLIVLNSHDHFRGIVPAENSEGFYLLDSMDHQPQLQTS